jgi:hypothetical protein
MAITRRQLLKSTGAAGALMLTRPVHAFAGALGPGDEFGTDRASRLFPGARVAHADMHNHTHLSDGSGDPSFAFESMRDSGLDVAALTDHSTFSWGAAGAATAPLCSAFDGEPEHGEAGDCRSLAGLDEAGWQLTAELADAAYSPGEFTAIRGFEWSSPFLGHVNVWFSQTWIDPAHTAGVGPSGWPQYLHQIPGLGPIAGGAGDDLLRANPARTGMLPFYEWLNADPSSPGLGGGLDGIGGFNHPGREPGRFDYFKYFPQMQGRIVSMEILNRRDDYLFEGYFDGQPSPLVECLNAGWRVGLLGVTDEHGTDWGFPDGKGRGGLWVPELTREGVREALERRQFFATFLRGLRLDAAAFTGAGPATDARLARASRMGQALKHRNGPVTFAVDIDRGADWVGMPLQIQVLRPGERFPEVAHVEDVRVPAPGEPVISFTVPLDAGDGDWVVLRIANPAGQNNQQGPEGHACNNLAVAYASPFWLDPA